MSSSSSQSRQHPPQRPRRYRALFALLLAAGLIRLTLAWATAGAPGDPMVRHHGSFYPSLPRTEPPPGELDELLQSAWLLELGFDPYRLDPEKTSFTPIRLFIARRAIHLSASLGISFGTVFKWLAIAADLGTIAALYALALTAGRSPGQAARAAGLFALNPISIGITSLQGGATPLVVCGVVLACLCLRRGMRLLVYFALGVAAAFEPFALLVVPFFLAADPAPPREKLRTVLVVPLPYLASLIGFIDGPLPALRGLFRGEPITSFGPLSLIHLGAVIEGASLEPTAGSYLLLRGLGKTVFGIIAACILYARRRAGLDRALLLLLLAFLVFYPGVGPGHLLAALSLALLPASGARRGWLLACTALASLALLEHYWLMDPGVYTGVKRVRFFVGKPELWLNLLTNGALFILCLLGALQVVLRPARRGAAGGRPPTAVPPGRGRSSGGTSGSPR